MSRALEPVFVGLVACAPVLAPPPASRPGETQSAEPRPSAAELSPSECVQGTPTLVRTTHKHSKTVALCQLAPEEQDATLAMRVVVEARSPETVTSAMLRNQGEYQATWTQGALQVASASPKPLGAQNDDLREVRALAAAVVGWPAGLARRSRVAGQEAPELAEPVRRIVDMRIRGEPVATVPRVRFRGAHAEPWGGALVFEVVLDGEVSSAGMCHRWSSATHAEGELLLRAAEGTFVTLTMRGTSKETEALCPEGAHEMGVSAEPRTCTAGETSLVLRWSCSG